MDVFEVKFAISVSIIVSVEGKLAVSQPTLVAVSDYPIVTSPEAERYPPFPHIA